MVVKGISNFSKATIFDKATGEPIINFEASAVNTMGRLDIETPKYYMLTLRRQIGEEILEYLRGQGLSITMMAIKNYPNSIIVRTSKDIEDLRSLKYIDYTMKVTVKVTG